eukprot:g78090.t1
MATAQAEGKGVENLCPQVAVLSETLADALTLLLFCLLKLVAFLSAVHDRNTMEPPAIPPKPRALQLSASRDFLPVNPSPSSQNPSRNNSRPPSPTPKAGQKAEIKQLPKILLGSDRKEKLKYEHLGDLFAIVVAVEHLEKAYVIDAVSDKEYQSHCKKLIAQYKTLREALKDDISSLEQFTKDYHMASRAAVNRLNTGVPATMVHGSSEGGADEKKKQLIVFHAVQHFITWYEECVCV